MSQQQSISQALPKSDTPALCVNLHSEQIATLAEDMNADGDEQVVHLLADESQIKDALFDFITASKIAELVDQGRLDIRILDEPVQNAILTTESEVVVPLMSGHTVTGSDEDIATSLYTEFEATFEAAESYNLRTPALSEVKATLREEIGDDTADEFEEVLAHAEEISNTNEYLDVVEVALLLAARNEVLLYDISRWGEDVGVASKATFSRTKSALEDAGLITTEKVPIDIGRPRLRLTATERIANADLTTLSEDTTSQI
ncbi:DUF5821 family protein [Halorubrum sp. AJ67]|uniref:transcriptional regulator TbsP domain-containing protein n=1 Tax=Halorubrum sp. AJ67 TaxID=1173487 RepID=UPI0003DB69C4|nr:DUF5821 family protein [Halorubrum sp. AJ67]CDK38145.1 uncharacterized protein BN903_345 [Halorubrum sp. AJ67]